MLIFVILFFGVALYKAKVKTDYSFFEDYSSADRTRAVNGICIMLILFSHTFAKVTPNGFFDDAYGSVRTFLGQFLVVPVLFYSGYGIMESINKKAMYIENFPVKRFLNLAVRFAIITIIYVIMHLIIGSEYSLRHILLSFAGITSIGNGGWYMLSTFAFYLSIIVCFNLFRKNKILSVIAVTLCLFALMIVEIKLDFPRYYYNTTFFFSVGMIYSLLKKYFDKILMKNNFVWAVCFILSTVGFFMVKKLVDISVLFYPVWCGLGMLMILCASMKIKICNSILVWLGKNIFFIFTLQGIPQIILSKYSDNNYLIYILTITVTFLLTYSAKYLFEKGENIVVKKLQSKCLKK